MATATTNTSAKAWSPDVAVHVPEDTVAEALIMQASTVVGQIEGDEPVVRVAYVDDATADFTAEGEEIPESDPELNEVLVATGKVSQLVRLSREQFVTNEAGARVAESVRRAIIKRANEAFLAQPAPTAPAMSPATGLLNVDGIIDGGAVSTDLDVLVDAFAALEANGATPTHIVLDPAGWGALRKIKTGTGSAQTLLGAGTADSPRMLLDVPVLVSAAMPANTGLVLDKAAVVSAVGNVLVSQSEHVYFTSDSVGVRCTWRIGQNVVRPDRVASFTVGTTD